MSEAMAFLVVMLGLLGSGAAIWIWVGRRKRPLAADGSIDWPPGLGQPGTRSFGLVKLLAVVGLAAIGGGGWYLMLPTWQQVYDRHLDQIDAVARQFLEIADLLPPPGEPGAPDVASDLDPLPVFDEVRDLFNTEIVPAEQLVDPFVSADPAGLYLSGDLALLLTWRHDPPYGNTNKASRHLDAWFEATLACRYLVVIRKILWPDTGATAHEVFVFDLRTNELVCQTVAADGEHSFVREQVLAALRRATRGTFVAR